jgi:hypothetical protein
MFFQTLHPCDRPEVLPSDGVQSVVLPSDDRPFDFKFKGNRLTLIVKDGQVTLRWSKRVCSLVQLEERQKLVQRIRRLDEAIGQVLEQITTLRNVWRLRGTVPDCFESSQYGVLQNRLSSYLGVFTNGCTTLHQIRSLDPEFGDEHHDWTVPLNNEVVSVILLPDLRPEAEEGEKIEMCFCFGSVAVPPTLKAMEAVVTIVPECCKPYRPFNVPPVWVDPQSNTWTPWEKTSAHVLDC